MLDLEAKKQFYIEKAQEIENKTYDKEIEEELNKYKEELIAKYEIKKMNDLGKIETYIELLNELIDENNSCSETIEKSIDEENNEEGGI